MVNRKTLDEEFGRISKKVSSKAFQRLEDATQYFPLEKLEEMGFNQESLEKKYLPLDAQLRIVSENDPSLGLTDQTEEEESNYR